MYVLCVCVAYDVLEHVGVRFRAMLRARRVVS